MGRPNLKDVIEAAIERNRMRAAGELLPCPFCGCEPISRRYPTKRQGGHCVVQCVYGSCDVRPEVWAWRSRRARIGWNRQFAQQDADDALIALAEELRGLGNV